MDVLGIEIVGPILARPDDTVPRKDAIPAIAQLIRERFETRTFLLRRCSPTQEGTTRRIFLAHRLFETTRLPLHHVRFCRPRIDEVLLCRELGITHFVSRNPKLFPLLVEHVPHLYFFPTSGDAKAQLPSAVMTVGNWRELVSELLEQTAH
jgi:hypothetical protein